VIEAHQARPLLVIKGKQVGKQVVMLGSRLY
jgi:hypothetical protein